MCGSSIPAQPSPPDHYAAETARVAAEKEERLAKASTARTAAQGTARSDAEAEAVRRGLNPADYSSIIDREISKTLGLIPEDDTAPGGYFTNFGKNVFDTEEQAFRSANTNKINQIAPTGFERNRTPDNIVDSTIEDIIGSQYNTGRSGLDAARARGTLTDTGYNSALGGLDTAKGGARAQFDPIATSVVDSVRGAQRGYVDEWRQRGAGASLGSTFDTGAFETGLNDLESREEGAIGSRIRAGAPTNLFDIGALINQGGQAQGAQNAPIIATPQTEQRKKSQRGLGTTGAF